MFLLIVTILVLVPISWLVLPHDSFKKFKKYLIYSYPSLVSNVEDFLYRNYDKVSLYKQSKVAVLTGGNRGIGVEVLKKLITCDITVVLGVRDPVASKKSIDNFFGFELDTTKVFYEKCDTGDMKSVRDFTKKVQEKFKTIHLLINNAGTMYLPFSKTKDGFETQMAVNFLGHALLTHLLLPQLLAGAEEMKINSRIVNVSSCAHKTGEINYDDFNQENGYDAGLQYCHSKLAQILFSNHVDKYCRDKKLNIQSHCVHPGVVDTDIFNTVPLFKHMKFLRHLILKTPERGSRTIVFATIAPEIEGQGGTYFSNCRKTSTIKIASDESECEKFFDFTCDLLKIKEFGLTRRHS